MKWSRNFLFSNLNLVLFLKDKITVKFSDINAQLHEIEKKTKKHKKISYRGSEREHNNLCTQRRKSKKLVSLGFNPVKTLYCSENFTPLNELLAWKCRDLKRASMINSTWNVWGVIRIRRTANERALLIKNYADLKSLYPDFVFRDR